MMEFVRWRRCIKAEHGRYSSPQWNIERGYKIAGIIEKLKQIDADVIALQEVDVGCERSGSIDTGVRDPLV